MSRVFGIGNDIVNISRIRRLLNSKHGNRFLNRAFHPNEINYFLSSSNNDYNSEEHEK